MTNKILAFCFEFLGLMGKVNENLGECLQVAIDTQHILETNYTKGN